MGDQKSPSPSTEHAENLILKRVYAPWARPQAVAFRWEAHAVRFCVVKSLPVEVQSRRPNPRRLCSPAQQPRPNGAPGIREAPPRRFGAVAEVATQEHRLEEFGAEQVFALHGQRFAPHGIDYRLVGGVASKVPETVRPPGARNSSLPPAIVLRSIRSGRSSHHSSRRCRQMPASKRSPAAGRPRHRTSQPMDRAPGRRVTRVERDARPPAGKNANNAGAALSAHRGGLGAIVVIVQRVVMRSGHRGRAHRAFNRGAVMTRLDPIALTPPIRTPAS